MQKKSNRHVIITVLRSLLCCFRYLTESYGAKEDNEGKRGSGNAEYFWEASRKHAKVYCVSFFNIYLLNDKRNDKLRDI